MRASPGRVLGVVMSFSQSASSSQLTVISLVKPRLNLAGGCRLQLINRVFANEPISNYEYYRS